MNRISVPFSIYIQIPINIFVFYLWQAKKDIFPPPELASPSDDDEIDLVRLEKVRAMMSGIDRRTRSKALPGSMEDDDDE